MSRISRKRHGLHSQGLVVMILHVAPCSLQGGEGSVLGGGAGALQLQDLSCARQRLRQCPVPPGEACVQTRLDPRTPGWTQQMETGGFPVEPVTPLDGDYSSSGAWAVQDPEGGAESISPSSCSQR